jgi:hypothetical protein
MQTNKTEKKIKKNLIASKTKGMTSVIPIFIKVIRLIRLFVLFVIKLSGSWNLFTVYSKTPS